MKTQSIFSRIFLLTLVLTVAGCTDKQEMDEYNKHAFKSGDTVGTLPDGRSVKAYAVKYYNTYHHIYVVEGSSSVSNNFMIGKFSAVAVTVDGAEYIKKEEEKEEKPVDPKDIKL